MTLPRTSLPVALRWARLFPSRLALYCFVGALAFDGWWLSLLTAVGLGAIGEWLARGFGHRKGRVVVREVEASAPDRSGDPVGRAWPGAQADAPASPPIEEAARDTTSSTDPLPDPLEGEHALIAAYAAVLEGAGEVIFSEERLPASSESIKTALLVVARAATAAGALSPSLRGQLRVRYASLASFVAPADAEVIDRFLDLAKLSASIGRSGDERLLHVADELSHHSRAVEIQKQRAEELARLGKEFDAAVRRR